MRFHKLDIAVLIILFLDLVFAITFDVCRVSQNDAQRTGLCDVGEFENRPPGTAAQLKN
jgi:hypothetical protein